MSNECAYREECKDLCTFKDTTDNKWYFWTESYDEVGPYDSEHEAALACIEYCHLELDGGFDFQWRRKHDGDLPYMQIRV